MQPVRGRMARRTLSAFPGRSPVYLGRRLRTVVERYGPTSGKAKERIRRSLRDLEPYGIRPTFATPGTVIQGDPAFFGELHEGGAELAIHGHDHADFRRLTPEQARWQFETAMDAFARHGIPYEGFRCPYLSYTPEVRAILPEGAFAYSSNRAVAWDVVRAADDPVFAQLARNYRGAPSGDVSCTPRLEEGLVEIPASVPDDLQLADGLALGTDGLLGAWLDMLGQTHARGELFAPLFHPEAYDVLAEALDGLGLAARARRPAVWLTQLRDVARWWRERSGFRAHFAEQDGRLSIELECTPRAVVLARGWRWPGRQRAWDGEWRILDDRVLHIDDGTRPLIGVAGVDARTVAFLVEQGYIVDDGERSAQCALTLTDTVVGELGTERRLIEHVERSEAPLLRFSPWPGEAKSAFCLAGDLDALSLRDYAARLRPAVRARSQ